MRKLPIFSLALLLLLETASQLRAQLPDDSCAVRYKEMTNQDFDVTPFASLWLPDNTLFTTAFVGYHWPSVTDSSSYGGIEVNIFDIEHRLLFSKTYRDHGWHLSPGSPHSLIQLSDGNLLLAGSRKDSTNSTSDGLLMKFTPKGDTIWTTLVGKYYQTFLFGALELDNGDLMVTGAQRGGVGSYDVFVARCDPQGKEMWSQGIGYPDRDIGSGIVQNPSDNGFLIYGHTSSGNSSGGISRYLLYVDSLGNKVWDKKMGMINSWSTEFLESVSMSGDGYLILSGSGIKYPDSSIGAPLPYIAKINWSGSIVWENHVEWIDSLYGHRNGFLKDVFPQEDGTYIAVGALAVWSSRWHGIIAKFSAAGELMWVRKYSPSYYFENAIVRVLPRRDEPGFFCYGTGHPGDTPQYDLWYMWLDQQGKLDTCAHVGTLPPVQDGALTLYPNPATGEATLLLPHLSAPGTVEVTAMSGALLLRMAVSPGQASLPLALDGLPTGIHLVTLTLPDGRRFAAKLALTH